MPSTHLSCRMSDIDKHDVDWVNLWEVSLVDTICKGNGSGLVYETQAVQASNLRRNTKS